MPIKYTQFTKVHFYLVPLVAAGVWWAMLTAFLICWSVQGKPIYGDKVFQNPVYLSDIAATNLQPLFISCAGFQGIFFVGTLALDFALRVAPHKRLQPYILKHQFRLGIAAICCAVVSELSILMVSIFNTVSFHSAHISMVGVFIVFAFGACVCNICNTFIFALHTSKLQPFDPRIVFGTQRWQNMYMVGAISKLLWVVIAAVFALIFGCCMHGNKSLSGAFEWVLCYWYGFLLVLWSIDMIPSAIISYRKKHFGNADLWQTSHDESSSSSAPKF